MVFKERPVKKLTDLHIRLYVVENVVLKNVMKLKLPAFIRIYPVVNISKVVRYRESMKEQKVEKPKLIEVDGEEE